MKKCVVVFCTVMLLIGVIALGEIKGLDRKSYISQFGWVIDEKSEECETVFIPDPLNDVYIRYNEIQKMAGFDLSAYCGKRAERFTYRVLNHKQGDGVFVNIIIYEGKVIGADIMSRELDGFMHEINRKEFKDAS